MKEINNSLSEGLKTSHETGHCEFHDKYRAQVAAAILSILAALPACSNAEKDNSAPSVNTSPAASDAGTELDPSNTPVTSEKTPLPFDSYKTKLDTHCKSRYGSTDTHGGVYPFMLVKGSKVKIVDACDPAGAHVVNSFPHRNGNFTDYYVPTTFGREEKNCYKIADTGNVSGINAERVNYDTYSYATRIPFAPFLNEYGTQTLVDGNSVHWVKAPLEKCPGEMFSGTTTPVPGGSRVYVYPAYDNKEALRLRNEAKKFRDEAEKLAAEAKTSAEKVRRDREHLEDTILNNNGYRVNFTPDAGQK